MHSRGPGAGCALPGWRCAPYQHRPALAQQPNVYLEPNMATVLANAAAARKSGIGAGLVPQGRVPRPSLIAWPWPLAVLSEPPLLRLE